jgi:hypothetical protein
MRRYHRLLPSCSGEHVFLATVWLLLLAARVAPAAETGSAPGTRWWIELSAPVVINAVGGDFEGSSILVSQSEIFLVPRVDNGAGFGLQFVFCGKEPQMRCAFGGGVGYIRSNHDLSFLGARGSGRLEDWILPFEFRFLPDARTEWVADFDVLISSFTVDDGSSNGSVVGDARYRTLGAALHAGPSIRVVRASGLRLDLHVGYRFVSYGVVYGVNGDKTSIEKDVGANAWLIRSGVTYSFKLD